MKSINPTNPVLNQTVSTSTPVKSSYFNLSNIASPQCAWIVNVGTGLTATFQIMISKDNVTYYDSGQVLPSVSGTAKTFPVQYSGGFPYVLIQVIQSSGSGTVLITGSAKGVA